MGLVLLRKGSQCFIGPVFTPFDPPTCVIIVSERLSQANLNNNTLPHEMLVYPPKIYFPTIIVVTVGPLPSHRASS